MRSHHGGKKQLAVSLIKFNMLLYRGFPDCVWVTGDRISLFLFHHLGFYGLFSLLDGSNTLIVSTTYIYYYYNDISLLFALSYSSAASLPWVQQLDYAATKVFMWCKEIIIKRLAVKLNLCLTNGSVVSNSWSWLVMEFTDAVKVNDPHEQPLCLPLAACLSLVLQYLWPHYKEQKSTSACLWQVSSLSLHLNVDL